jgi:hypothetical protein
MSSLRSVIRAIAAMAFNKIFVFPGLENLLKKAKPLMGRGLY